MSIPNRRRFEDLDQAVDVLLPLVQAALKDEQAAYDYDAAMEAASQHRDPDDDQDDYDGQVAEDSQYEDAYYQENIAKFEQLIGLLTWVRGVK